MSHGAFFQTNTEMAERLYAVAAEYAGLSGGERLFDLYCGIGTIGLTMAARAGEVWGLELVPEAIADAERNAERNGIDNARFVAGDVRIGVRPLLERAGRPDVVVVDPPRAGLSKKIVRRVIECEAKRIVYVSCNPTTLAPNAAQLVEAGYRLRRVRPVDMFPQTPHIECVALLEKQQSESERASESPPGSTPRWRGRSPPAARSSATTRCGRTTIRGAKGLETLAEFADAAPRLELGVAVMALDRTPPAEIAADIERARPRPGAPLARGRRGLLGEAADAACATSLPELREQPARRPPRARRDGPEDVRARRRRVRRRLLQLDDAGVRRRRSRAGRGRRPARPAASRHRSSATSAPRSAPTPPSASPRRSPSTATSTTATATTSRDWASPRAPSASPPPTRDAAQEALAAYTALDTVVVRGLASATVEAMTAVAEAAAP